MGDLSRAHHLSIVWGVTLAIITLVEWRSLERDPIAQQILTPFIEREIALVLPESKRSAAAANDAGGRRGEPTADTPRYEVEFHFNGPLFLACFFGPVLVFHGIDRLLARLKNSSSPRPS